MKNIGSRSKKQENFLSLIGGIVLVFCFIYIVEYLIVEDNFSQTINEMKTIGMNCGNLEYFPFSNEIYDCVSDKEVNVASTTSFLESQGWNQLYKFGFTANINNSTYYLEMNFPPGVGPKGSTNQMRFLIGKNGFVETSE